MSSLAASQPAVPAAGPGGACEAAGSGPGVPGGAASPGVAIKDRSGMDLTEGEEIKKRWQEYTEELYKKDLNDPDNYHGVITHLEPDILECKVTWALRSIT